MSDLSEIVAYGEFHPERGERLMPAWMAVVPVLADFGWHPYAEVEGAALAASDIVPQTVETLLRGADYAGEVARKGRVFKNGRDSRMVRFTPYGWHRWVAGG